MVPQLKYCIVLAQKTWFKLWFMHVGLFKKENRIPHAAASECVWLSEEKQMSAAPSDSSISTRLCSVCLHADILQHTGEHRSHERYPALLQLHPPSTLTHVISYEPVSSNISPENQRNLNEMTTRRSHPREHVHQLEIWRSESNQIYQPNLIKYRLPINFFFRIRCACWAVFQKDLH